MDTAPDWNAGPLAADVHPPGARSDAMTPDGGAIPDPALAELRDKFGAVWQIDIGEPAGFIAVRRPTPTAQHILVGHSLPELERKLVAERDSGEVGST